MRELTWRKSFQSIFGSCLGRNIDRSETGRRPLVPLVEELEGRLTPAAPVVLSINRLAPAPPSTSSAIYNVTFDQSVTGVDAADFKVATTGSLTWAPTVVVAGSGASYTVTISGLRGSGDLRLDLIDDDSITAGGLALGGPGTVNGSFQGPTSTVVQAYPSIVSINRAAPATIFAPASTAAFTVTFSEAVTGVDANDFTIVKTGTLNAALLQVTTVSPSIYTATLTGITGLGTLGLNFADNGSIRALDGTRLSAVYAPLAFANQATYATGVAPASVAIGDLNADGKPDLVVANRDVDTVGVFLGNGDGTFQKQKSFATSFGPNSLAIADLNGDGKPDLVVANSSGVRVSVLLGNGNGTFQAQRPFTAGATPFSLTLADFNGDGKRDIAAANPTDNRVAVLLGNGNGTFQPHKTFVTGTDPVSVTSGDINGDGKVDLAVGNLIENSVSVLLGNGNGTFQVQQTFAAGRDALSLTLADLSGDGKLDLAVVNASDNSISVLLGDGDGAFQPQKTFATGASPYAMTIGDVNGDGKPDLAVTNSVDNTAGVLLGNGNGTFQKQMTFAARGVPLSVALGDVNGDGRPDLAVTNYDSNTVSVLLGIGNGNVAGQTYTIEPAPVPPSVVSVTLNVGLPAFANAQRSRVVNIAVVFDQAVQLDANAFNLSLHLSNVIYDGIAQPNGMGAIPTLTATSSTDLKTWTVTFSGPNVDTSTVDGLSSLKDGVYDFSIGGAKVHPTGVPGVSMSSSPSVITFHRLYGDTNAPSSTSNGAATDFSAIVNSSDNLAFRNAFNKSASGGYVAFLDFTGDGIINSGDNLQFRGRFNKTLTWRA